MFAVRKIHFSHFLQFICKLVFLGNAGFANFAQCDKLNENEQAKQCLISRMLLLLLLTWPYDPSLVNINTTKATSKHTMSLQNTWGNELQISSRVALHANAQIIYPPVPCGKNMPGEMLLMCTSMWLTWLQASHYNIDLLNSGQTV